MAVASLLILQSLDVEDFRTDLGAYQSDQAHLQDPSLGDSIADSTGAGSTRTAPIAELPYGVALAESLQAFKDGSIETFQGKSYEVRAHDLAIIKTPYVVIGLVVIGVWIAFLVTPMPQVEQQSQRLPLGPDFSNLFKNKRYLEGVVAQGFYVGAQIMCWTFIIHYATSNLGMSAASAQNHNILAMGIFCVSRFVCTFFLKYISPGRLLMALSAGAILLTLGVILSEEWLASTA